MFFLFNIFEDYIHLEIQQTITIFDDFDQQAML